METTEDLIRDIMLVSAGTLATLTGIQQYDDLDEVRRSWMQYAASTRATGRWQDSWKKFYFDHCKGGETL